MVQRSTPMRITWLAAVLAFAAIGCADSQETAKNPAAASPAEPPKVTQTAQEAAKTVLDGLKASKPIVLWNVLDTTTQKGTNTIIRDLATTIDPEVWDHSVRNLKKLVVLLETKKDDILNSPLWKTTKAVKVDDVKANWKAGVALLKTLVSSELVDREKMRNFDGKAFLEGTGAQLYVQARELTKLMKDDPLKRFDELKANLKEVSPQNFEVTLEAPNSKEKLPKVNLTVRDGRWTIMQAQMVNIMLSFGVRPFVARFQPYALVEWKDDYLRTMDRLEKTLDKLQASNSSAEFQSILAPQVLALAAQLSRTPKPVGSFDQLSRGRLKNTAIVLIKGEHFGDEPDVLAITNTLRHFTEESQTNLSGPQHVENSTVYLVGQVSDPNSLAEKIKVGKIAAVDVKRNIVTVEIPESDANKKDAGKGKSSAEASTAEKSTAK